MQLGNDVKTWNVMIGFSAVLLAGVAAAEFFLPKPSLAVERNKAYKKQDEMKGENKQLTEKIAEFETLIKEHTYPGKPEEITPKILESVNKVAAANNKITVKSFRPQKPVEAEGIARLTYTVQLAGKFQDIVSFVRAGDEQSTLFGVTLLQVASADGETDNVNATVGVSAFAVLPEEKKATSTSTITKKTPTTTTKN